MRRRNSLIVCFIGGAFLTLSSCTQKTAANRFQSKQSIEEEKIALGKKLFFDTRLSSDNTISCSSCHDPKLAFTNGKQFGVGINGQLTNRNVPSIINAKFQKTLMFDGELESLERQIIVPVQEHNEMNSKMGSLIKELGNVPEYSKSAKRIFNRSFDAWVLTRSIAAYERSLVKMNSRFDRFQKGRRELLTASEKRGYKLFSEQLYCTKCHPVGHFTTFSVANNGLYKDYGSDQGRFRITEDPKDKGKFKIPGLRNVSVTSPYMHDGSFSSLEEVVKHYEEGGKRHANQSKIIQPFHLSSQQRADLVSFLRSLDDY